MRKPDAVPNFRDLTLLLLTVGTRFMMAKNEVRTAAAQGVTKQCLYLFASSANAAVENVDAHCIYDVLGGLRGGMVRAATYPSQERKGANQSICFSVFIVTCYLMLLKLKRYHLKLLNC